MKRNNFVLLIPVLLICLPIAFAEAPITAVYTQTEAIKYVLVLDGDANMTDISNQAPTYNTTYYQATISSTYPIYKASSAAQGIMFTTPAANYTNLSAVGVRMGNYFPQQQYEEDINLTLTIRNDSGTSPNGTIFATATLSMDDLALAGTGGNTLMQLFVLNQTLQIPNATLYWIRIDSNNWGGAEVHNYFTVNYHNANVYSGGAMMVSTTDGAAWATSTTYVEMAFALFNQDGVDTYNYVVTNTTNQRYVMGINYTLNPVATGRLTLLPGDTIVTNHTVAGSGYGICSGCYFSGGVLNISGNSTNMVTLVEGNLRSAYGLIASDASDRHTKVVANYFNETELTTFGGAYLSGTYSQFEFKNSIFDTSGYDASALYTIRFMYNDRYSMFNNVTFTKGCGATCYYSLYFYANVVNHNWKFVDCKIERAGAVSTTAAIYDGVSLGYERPTFINTTHRGSALTSADFLNAYAISAFMLGTSVVPTIKDVSGNPIPNATVTLIPQFDETRDLPRWFMGSKSFDPYDMAVYTYFQLYDTFDNSRTARTNVDGKPVDVDGNTVLYMKDGLYYDTDEHRVTYYGGSNLSLRPNGYTWNNNGSDYGYILQVTADGYQGRHIIIDSNVSYSEDIMLYETSVVNVSGDGTNPIISNVATPTCTEVDNTATVSWYVTDDNPNSSYMTVTHLNTTQYNTTIHSLNETLTGYFLYPTLAGFYSFTIYAVDDNNNVGTATGTFDVRSSCGTGASSGGSSDIVTYECINNAQCDDGDSTTRNMCIEHTCVYDMITIGEIPEGDMMWIADAIIWVHDNFWAILVIVVFFVVGGIAIYYITSDKERGW